MNSNPGTRAVYLEIKKNRFRKKKKLYKLAFGVSFDLTISIYLALFAVLGSIILYDTLQQFQVSFDQVEEFFSANYVIVWLMLIIRHVAMSFTRSGILFSSAEWKMILLPHSKEQVWMLCAMDKWLRDFLFFLFFVLLLAWLTPFSILFLFAFAGFFIITELLMIIPQWMLYQKSFTYKLAVLVIMAFLGSLIWVAIHMIHSNYVWFWTILAVLSIINWALSGKHLWTVDWSKVVRSNDSLIWNMWFINKMSDTKVEPIENNGWFSRVRKNEKRKQVFDYRDDTAVFRRLWGDYFLQEIEAVIWTVGGILIVFLFLSFHGAWLFGIAIALAVFFFGKMAASFFSGRFTNLMIYSLPWEWKGWRRSFFIWMRRAGLLLCPPLLGLLLFHQQEWVWIPVQLGFYISAASYFTQQQIAIRIAVLSNKQKFVRVYENIFVILMFLFIIISISFPVASLFAVAFMLKKKTAV